MTIITNLYNIFNFPKKAKGYHINDPYILKDNNIVFDFTELLTVSYLFSIDKVITIYTKQFPSEIEITFEMKEIYNKLYNSYFDNDLQNMKNRHTVLYKRIKHFIGCFALNLDVNNIITYRIVNKYGIYDTINIYTLDTTWTTYKILPLFEYIDVILINNLTFKNIEKVLWDNLFDSTIRDKFINKNGKNKKKINIDNTISTLKNYNQYSTIQLLLYNVKR